jgi:hypothetical protein
VQESARFWGAARRGKIGKSYSKHLLAAGKGVRMLAPVHCISSSEQSLISNAALILLFLSIAAVIWPKFASLIRAIWTDVAAAISAIEEFFRHRKRNRGHVPNRNVDQIVNDASFVGSDDE